MVSRKFTTWRTFALLLGIAGAVIRLALSSISYGTNDVTTWLRFADYIGQHGLIALYEHDGRFNHPPVAGYMVALLKQLADRWQLDAPFLLRLPGIVAECGAAYLLWLIWSSRGMPGAGVKAVGAFGISLISILVSGYHGNTDGIYAFILLWSIFLLEEKRAALWSGFAIGLAVNIKLIPVLFLIPVLSRCRNRKELSRFLGAFTLSMLPYLLALLAAGSAFFRNVFQYNSHLDYWGFELFFLLGRGSFPAWQSLFDTLINVHQETGRYLILGSIAVLTCFNHVHKRWNGYELCALSFVLFAVLAPGFGVQYLITLPALVLANRIDWGLKLSFLCGAVALTSYLSFLVSTYPLRSIHTAASPEIVILLAYVAWAGLVAYCVESFRASRPGEVISGQQISRIN